MKHAKNCNGTSLISLLLIIVVILGIVLAFKILNPVKKVSEEETKEFLNTASNAKKENEIAEEKEVIRLAYHSYINSNSTTNTITKEGLLEYIIRDVTVKEIKDASGEQLLEIQFDDTKNVYTLNNNGKITQK